MILGTPEERGLIAWEAQHDLSGENAKKYAGVSLRQELNFKENKKTKSIMLFISFELRIYDLN